MSYKPKPVQDHYIESLAVNSQNLAKQLEAIGVQPSEIRSITNTISAAYMKETEKIARECERDMMALERVPSPLRLFIDCMDKLQSLSPAAAKLVKQYSAAWEDWM